MMTLADYQDDWQFEEFRIKREREIAEQGLQAALEYRARIAQRKEDAKCAIAGSIVLLAFVLMIFFV